MLSLVGGPLKRFLSKHKHTQEDPALAKIWIQSQFHSSRRVVLCTHSGRQEGGGLPQSNSNVWCSIYNDWGYSSRPDGIIIQQHGRMNNLKKTWPALSRHDVAGEPDMNWPVSPFRFGICTSLSLSLSISLFALLAQPPTLQGEVTAVVGRANKHTHFGWATCLDCTCAGALNNFSQRADSHARFIRRRH